jgi:hypothetical protein
MNDTVSRARRALYEAKVRPWKEALQAAEATAASDPKNLRRTYQINYRVQQPQTEKGTPNERRQAVVDLIEALSPFEEHQSTSTWLVALHIQDAPTIVDLLSAPLEAEHDFLHVAEVTENRKPFGDPHFDSHT